MNITRIDNYSPDLGYVYELDGNGKVIGKKSFKAEFKQAEPKKYDRNEFLKWKEEMEAQGYQVADFSSLKTIEDYYASEEMIKNAASAEEARQLKCIRLGLLHKKEYFNFSNAGDYDKLTAEQDFTGMSKAEKYTAIYEKYQHCYGENFLQAFSRDFIIPSAERDDYTKIELQWYKELTAEFGNISKARKACREALYGKMDETSVRNEIIAKYREKGNDTLTFRDLYDMSYEMSLCGVDHGMSGAVDEIFDFYGGYYMQQPGAHGELLREQMLDEPVTADHFKYMTDVQSSKLYFGNATDPQKGMVIGQIQSAFSDKLRAGGRSNTLSSLAERMSTLQAASKKSSAAALSAYKNTASVLNK